jgi:hypothetical protein
MSTRESPDSDEKEWIDIEREIDKHADGGGVPLRPAVSFKTVATRSETRSR